MDIELRDKFKDSVDAEAISEAFKSLGAVDEEVTLDVICDETGIIWSSPNAQN